MGQRLALGFTGPVKIGRAISVVLGAQFTLLLSVGSDTVEAVEMLSKPEWKPEDREEGEKN